MVFISHKGAYQSAYNNCFFHRIIDTFKLSFANPQYSEIRIIDLVFTCSAVITNQRASIYTTYKFPDTIL